MRNFQRCLDIRQAHIAIGEIQSDYVATAKNSSNALLLGGRSGLASMLWLVQGQSGLEASRRRATLKNRILGIPVDVRHRRPCVFQGHFGIMVDRQSCTPNAFHMKVTIVAPWEVDTRSKGVTAIAGFNREKCRNENKSCISDLQFIKI